MNAPRDRREHRREALEHIGLDTVGALSSADERAWVREHLESGCPVCTNAAAEITSLFDDLLLAARPVEPPAALRSRVLEAVRDSAGAAGNHTAAARPDAKGIQVWNRWPATRGSKFYTLPDSGDDWEATSIPGIAVRPLHVDEARDRVTMLIRMDAGTSYPRHRHGDDEECYVLQGDLSVEDEALRAGDYQFAPQGSIHGVQSTIDGCTLLIVSSRRDEILTV